MTRTIVAIVLGGLVACACEQSHGPPIAGIDSNRRMNSLTEEEWGRYCAWEQRLHPRPFTVYSCHNAEVLDGNCYLGRRRPCVDYSWIDFDCMRRGTRIRYQSHPGCQNTLAQEAACQEAIANGPPCHLAFPLPPECEVVMDCPSDPYMTPDSGMIDASPNVPNPTIDPSLRLSNLTSTDWATLCQWTTEQIPLDRYYCDADSRNRGGVTCDGCVLIDRSMDACMTEGVLWQERTADCPPTVADWLECTRDRLYEPFECDLFGPDSCLDIQSNLCSRR